MSNGTNKLNQISKNVNSIKVSIVIPMFNVEGWIEECLNSLLPLSHKGIEVIVVNDGSTDRSRDLASDYETKFKHFKLHDQLNKGASEARNQGLKIATGEYVTFLDSDDYFDPKEFEEFMEETLNLGVDISTGNGRNLLGPDLMGLMKKADLIKTLGVISGARFYLLSNAKKEFLICAPVRLYKMSFLVKFHLTFYPGIIHEDEEFAPKVFCLAQSTVYLDKKFYIHRYRIGSVTKSEQHKYLNPKSFPAFLLVIQSLRNFLMDQNLDANQVKVLKHAIHKCTLEILRRELYYSKEKKQELMMSNDSKEKLKNILMDNRFDFFQKINVLKFKFKILLNVDLASASFGTFVWDCWTWFDSKSDRADR